MAKAAMLARTWVLRALCGARGAALGAVAVLAVWAPGCFGCEGRCVPGASAVCGCTDGRVGAQLCQDDHTFAPCVCTGGGADGSLPADAGAGDGAVPCVPAQPPIEVCNAADDDCDGTVDLDDCVAGLEAWYRFEETEGPVLDSSGNGWDGTALGAVLRGDIGAVGSAVTFPGATGDRISVVGGPSYDVSGGWTVEAWVGYPEPAGNGTLAKGPGGGAPGSLDFELFVTADPGGGSAVASWGACDVATCYSVPGALWMAVDRFVHVGLSWDGLRLHGYLNGVEYVTQLESGAFFGLWTNDLSMGNFVVATPMGWAGTLDEVKLWSVSRSEEEVCVDAHGTFAVGPPATCALP
jgi:hypothetical protein